MRFSTLFVALVLLASVAVSTATKSNVIFCKKDGKSEEVVGTDNVFGCNGYASYANQQFIVSSKYSRTFRFLNFSTESYDYLTVSTGSKQLLKLSGTPDFGVLHTAPGDLTWTFKADGSTEGPGWAAAISEGPVISSMTPGFPASFTGRGQGGFMYFSQPIYTFAASSAWTVTVKSYQGLQPPSLFTARGYLPSLSNYDQIATTVEKDGTWVASLSFSTPSSGTNYLGIFLYGTAGSVVVQPSFSYSSVSIPSWTKEKLNDLSAGTRKVYKRLQTTKDSSFFQVQLSRKQPGGYPRVYIRQGFPPTLAEYDYVLDTTQQNFFDLKVTDVYDSKSPNAGTWIFMYESQATSFFLLKANWD